MDNIKLYEVASAYLDLAEDCAETSYSNDYGRLVKAFGFIPDGRHKTSSGHGEVFNFYG